MAGPLEGIRVVELAGIGPGPYAATILADLGADVVRIARPGPQLLAGGQHDLLIRSRPSTEVDLKSAEGLNAVLQLVEHADVLIEGLRPGVTERIGLGPEVALARNGRLVYARMTGWGQDGPLARSAGHDVTYLATTGVLHGLGQDRDRPQFPVNLLGDFGGGSTFLVIGILAALQHAQRTGVGQVVDAAIVDGASYLDLMGAGLRAAGTLTERRGTGLLDGGVPYYRLYRTRDDRWVAVGAIEPQFFALLIKLLDIEDIAPPQDDVARHEELADLLAITFASRTMAEWAQTFEGTDACVAPVLTPTEALSHPHMTARATYVEVDGVTQPNAAPRFSISAPGRPTPPSHVSAESVLARWRLPAHTTGSKG